MNKRIKSVLTVRPTSLGILPSKLDEIENTADSPYVLTRLIDEQINSLDERKKNWQDRTNKESIETIIKVSAICSFYSCSFSWK